MKAYKKRQSVVDKIKAIDIVEFFEKYGFEVIPGGSCRCCSGGYYKIVCPLHDDRNPSLHIHPDTHSWYCWGCGEGGSILDFVMRYEGLSIKDAIKKYVDNYKGIKYPLKEKKKKSKKFEENAQRRRWLTLSFLIRDKLPLEKQDEMFYYLDLAYDRKKLTSSMREKIFKKIKKILKEVTVDGRFKSKH